MKHALLIAPLMALGLAALPAQAETTQARAEAPQEARIAFVNHGGIRDWRSDDRSTIYVQDAHRNWYRATLMTPAFDLPYAMAIGFDTGPIDTLDRFSSVIVAGQRYPIQSFVKIDGPPPSKHEREAA